MRSCCECGMQYFGRSDKKFCTDSCRSQFHNRKRQNEDDLTRLVNRLLYQNRKILREFQRQGRKVVHRDLLLRQGFTFNYYTNEQMTDSSEVYRYCYEQGYKVSDNDFVALHEFRQ